MLKMGMGGSGPSGKQPLGSTISGAGPPLGANLGYQFSCGSSSWQQLVFVGRLTASRNPNFDVPNLFRSRHCCQTVGGLK